MSFSGLYATTLHAYLSMDYMLLHWDPTHFSGFTVTFSYFQNECPILILYEKKTDRKMTRAPSLQTCTCLTLSIRVVPLVSVTLFHSFGFNGTTYVLNVQHVCTCLQDQS